MIKVLLAACLSFVAWFYSVLRYYDFWKRGKVPVIFFVLLHIFSIGVIVAFEVGLLAMKSDFLSVCGYAYEMIYGSVMILTPVLCFFRGVVRFAGKKKECSGKFYRFFNHPTKLILIFLIITFCGGICLFGHSRMVEIEESAISLDYKKTDRNVSILYVTDCLVGTNMTTGEFRTLVEKINQKQPDVILFGGNLLAKNSNENVVADVIESMKKLKTQSGIYMIEGEQDASILNQEKGAFSKIGIHLLLDESVFLNNGIQIVGCRADKKLKKPMSYTLSLIDKDKPSIVLSRDAIETKWMDKKNLSAVLYPRKITESNSSGKEGVQQSFPRNIFESAKIHFIKLQK